MLVFIIEALAACLLLTVGCLLSTRRLTDNSELAKLNYPPEICAEAHRAGTGFRQQTTLRMAAN